VIPRLSRRAFLAALPLLGACAAGRRADAAGSWVGTVDDGSGPTRIEIELRPDRGGFAGTMSLRAHRLLGKALVDVAVDGDRVAMTLPAHIGPLRFTGRIDGDSLAGTIAAPGGTLPLLLRRARVAPPPYREERVSFASEGATLSGSLLLPPGAGPFPAVILIHGSSTPDRNDFRYWADLYARSGIAALIYDKRPTGPETFGGTATLETLALDVLAAARMLEGRRDIAPALIGLWGFSQGGWVAPLAAAARRFAFVATLSAPGVSYAEVVIHADTTRLRARGFPAPDVAEAEAAERRFDAFVRGGGGGGGGDPAALQAFLDAAHRRPWAALTSLPERLPTPAERQAYLRWRDLDLDPAPYWRHIAAPVFLAAGTEDRNVPAAASAARIARALREGGNEDVTVRLYRGADHSLEPAPTLERDLIDWTRALLRRDRR
jgi:dienelactone hydrolase